MTPFEIHEAPIRNFGTCIQNALRNHGLDSDEEIACEVHFNTTIRKGSTVVTPDFLLDLRPVHHIALDPIPVWVGECGFSSSRQHMIHQLKSVIAICPEVDTVLMICLREARDRLPDTNHPLHAAPELLRSVFSPTSQPVGHFQPVVVEGIKWLEVKSIYVQVFHRGSDGNFNFEDDESELCATRVSSYIDYSEFYRY